MEKAHKRKHMCEFTRGFNFNSISHSIYMNSNKY